MAMERVSGGAMRTDAEVARVWDENADLWIRHVRAGWDRYREEAMAAADPRFARLRRHMPLFLYFAAEKT